MRRLNSRPFSVCASCAVNTEHQASKEKQPNRLLFFRIELDVYGKVSKVTTSGYLSVRLRAAGKT